MLNSAGKLSSRRGALNFLSKHWGPPHTAVNMSLKSRSLISADILIIVSVCIVTRLPQLLSPYLILDGDESIVGLMAKHIFEGKALPVFFYGQDYGFSLIESGLCSLLFFVGGVNEYSVKTAMLLLWTTGVIFLYKTLKELAVAENKLPLLVTIILCLSPAWAVWSMKARGGYLTAFTCSSVIGWLLFDKRPKNQRTVLFIIGLLLVIVYESLPLWLAGLLPFLVYKLYTKLDIPNILLFCSSIVLSLFPFIYVQKTSSYYLHSRTFDFRQSTVLANFKGFPKNLYHSLHGYFYLDRAFSPSIFSAIFACMVGIGTVLLCAVGLYILTTRRIRPHGIFLISLLPILLTVSYSLFFAIYAPRYLLPLTGWVYISFFLLIQHIQSIKAISLFILVLIIIGVPSMLSFKNYNFQKTTKADLFAAMTYLQQQHVDCVFVANGLLQWQIMFYTHEKIVARYQAKTDRYPQYVEVVNAALAKNQNVALIGYNSFAAIPAGTRTINVNGYYIILRPDRALLEKLDFRF